eukprot:TRINITY_DN4419_c4_g1_i1.p1 TRINITY_DN4419_c4_g1~~TRINITY_DN4419_c4_g1_i1.p1  ORF type:complete len:400 (+),score=98.52 TRINITY_DN4419_c4_g1_i1:99-1298(+)
MARFVLTSAAALALVTEATEVPRMREALLTEAYHRLNDWFLNPDWVGKPAPLGRLDYPKEEFGVQLMITTGKYQCDSEVSIAKHEADTLANAKKPHAVDSIPITFGRFDVKDADPIDVFNALADITSQKDWDPLIGRVKLLGDFENEAARGAAVTFVAHPFPDRQVFQWQTYNSTRDHKDMMVAFSTRRNGELHKVEEQAPWPSVMAENCLGAYHVVALPNGGCHVVFSSMVNSHPPWPITAKFVFNLLWTKTVEYIQNLRARAQHLKKQRGSNPGKLAVPEWLVYEGEKPDLKSPSIKTDAAKTDPPYSGMDYVSDIATVVLDDANARPALKEVVPAHSDITPPVMLVFCCCFLLVSAVMVYKRSPARSRSTVPEVSEPVFDAIDETELSPALLSTEA